MSVLRSFVLLASVSLAVAFALFVGYGLALKHTMPMIIGVAFLGAAAALMFLQTRADGKRAR